MAEECNPSTEKGPTPPFFACDILNILINKITIYLLIESSICVRVIGLTSCLDCFSSISHSLSTGPLLQSTPSALLSGAPRRCTWLTLHGLPYKLSHFMSAVLLSPPGRRETFQTCKSSQEINPYKTPRRLSSYL